MEDNISYAIDRGRQPGLARILCGVINGFLQHADFQGNFREMICSTTTQISSGISGNLQQGQIQVDALFNSAPQPSDRSPSGECRECITYAAHGNRFICILRVPGAVLILHGSHCWAYGGRPLRILRAGCRAIDSRLDEATARVPVAM